MKLFWALTAAALLLSPSANAAEWKADLNQSEVAFSGTNTGKPFTGKFGTWQARINFDKDHLDTSNILVTFDTASAHTGDRMQDETLPGAEWLDSKTFPTATFEAKSITAKGENQYEAHGKLTIKGVTKDVTLPFLLKSDGNTAQVTGETTVSRLDFGIGVKSDATGEWVGKDVKIAVKLAATSN